MKRFFRGIFLIRILFITNVLLSVSITAKADNNTFVVVIDAGHGGRDAGALGRKTKEKEINLSVALRLGKLIEQNCSGVKVVYTRKDDRFVELQQRAQIANKAKGNLFISIHTNSIDRKNKNRTTIQGASTYTLGLHRTDENLEVTKRENAVILLEDDYTTRYEGFDPNSTESYIIFELIQSKHMEQSIDFASLAQKEFRQTAARADKGVRQGGLLVLRETGMPAVLVELDFICNPTQENFMASDQGQQKLALSLYRAFQEYKAAHDRKNGSLTKRDEPKEEIRSKSFDQQEIEIGDTTLANHVKTIDPSESKIVYKIQIASSTTPIKKGSTQFKGLQPITHYREKGMYKYTYFESDLFSEVQRELKKVKRKIPDAFIIRFQDGKRIVN